VRRLSVFLLSVVLFLAVIFFSSKSVSANHQEDVLGVASPETLSIPSTAEGPGFVLPDSPLFFLDRIKQGFRLLLAFTPEQKAKIHNGITGERLAELRIMLVKNNIQGVRVALQGISDNSKAASEDLADAKLAGRNIDLLAKAINDSIKEKQKTLSELILQAKGEIKAQVIATKEALKIAKVKTEESLPRNLMVNETIDDLNQQIYDSIDSASLSAGELNRAMNALNKISSNAAVVRNESELTNLTNQFQNAEAKLQKETPVLQQGKSTEATNSKSIKK
jgi:hypothetical protein